MYNKSNAQFITQKFIETGRFVALEDFVQLTKNIFGCDRDYLYRRLVEAHVSNPQKMYDILEYMEEEEHKPSKKLSADIATILRTAGLEVPASVAK